MRGIRLMRITQILLIICSCFLLSAYLHADEYVPTNDNSKSLAQDSYELAEKEYDAGNYQSSVRLSEEALTIIPTTNSTERLPYIRLIGRGYLKIGLYNKALEHFILGLEKSEKIDNKKEIAEFTNCIGLYFYALKDYDKALEYYEKAAKIRKEINDTEGLITSYNNLGVINKVKDNYTEALEYYNKSLALVEAFYGKDYNYIAALNNTGNVLKELGQYEEALSTLNEALESSEQQNLKYFEALCLHNIGSVHYKMENFGMAIPFIKKSLTISEELKTPNLILASTSGLSDSYKEIGDFEKALEYSELYFKYQKEELTKKSDRQFAFMQTRFETSQKDKEIALLEKEKVLADTKRYMLFGGVILLAAAGFFVYNRQRKLLQKEKQLVEIEKKDNLRLESELVDKNKELTNFALHLAQRNDFLQEIKKELGKTSKMVEKPNAQGRMQEMMVNIHQYISHNKEEQEFMRKLEEVNASFFRNLTERVPGLSEKEKKLCALLRLRLSSKEIASVTNITSKSVDMNRYRLRKKLNLTAEQDLYDFLMTI